MVVKPDLDALITELENWLKTQPQLPQGIQKLVLKRFLYSMYCDLEGAKRLIELNYTLRNKYPHIFIDRDPNDESIQQLFRIADLMPLPGLTPEKYKLLLYRFVDTDPSKFDFNAGVKAFFMMADVRFIQDDDTEIIKGEIPVYDMNGYTLRHMAKTSISTLKIYMKFVQEAHPMRLKEIHVINCPSYVNKVMAMIKPFIRGEVFKLIHWHTPNSDTLYNYFPRDMLPEEYGGKAGKLPDLKKHWMNALKEKRDYLLDPNQWQMDKTKKPNSTTSATHKSSKSINEGFKSLEID